MRGKDPVKRSKLTEVDGMADISLRTTVNRLDHYFGREQGPQLWLIHHQSLALLAQRFGPSGQVLAN